MPSPGLASLTLRSASFLAFLAVAAGCSTAAEDKTIVGGDSELTMAELPVRLNDVAAGVFEQQIDHTEGSTVGTFKQRYWYSTQFASGADAPVIFHFCGESECAPGYLSSLADTAKVLKAALITIEHRYYGKSIPFAPATAPAPGTPPAPLTLGQMKYLTIHNALEDAATFEAFAKDKLNLKGKWIAVGGSYPGMLAAFYRQKHPELVVGAWASSAPVQMQESFFGYDQVASRALGKECGDLFRSALDTFDAAWSDPAKLADVTQRVYGRPLQLPPTIDAESLKYVKFQWTQPLSGQAMGAAQYGNTHNLCSALAQHADAPLDGLVGYMHPPLVAEDSDTAHAPGAAAAAHPEEVVLLGPGANATDASTAAPDTTTPTSTDDQPYKADMWSYQECSEVGFFKVFNPDRTETIMTESQDVDVARARCMNIANVLPPIEQTRATYLDPIANGQASNILFVNGSLDPWSSLSYTDAAHAPAGTTVHVVALGSHCTDLQNLNSQSALGVFEAHKIFHDLAVTWLAQ